MSVRIKRVHSPDAPMPSTVSAQGSTPPPKSLRQFQMETGLRSVQEMRDEVDGFMDVLMGRESPPIDNGPLALMEFANAAYSRVMEMTMLIQRAESDGLVAKGSKLYRFRTGELRNFLELASKAVDLGSRRVTAARMAYDQEYG